MHRVALIFTLQTTLKDNYAYNCAFKENVSSYYQATNWEYVYKILKLSKVKFCCILHSFQLAL